MTAEAPKSALRVLVDWWKHIPEPTYDSSVRAPREWLFPTIVFLIAAGAVVSVAYQAFERFGWPA